MHRNTKCNILLGIILALVSTGTMIAGDIGDLPATCCRCGCHCPCRTVCRCVMEEKKVEVVCWGYEEEQFCLPGPSCEGCPNCELACKGSEPDGDRCVHSKSKLFVWTKWFPTWAAPYTRRKLVKKTVTKTIPSYKWVTEPLCPACAECAATDQP